MKRGWIWAGIVIVLMAIITYLNFTYDWNIGGSSDSSDEGSADFTDTCIEVPPENFSVCEPGTHNCTISFTWKARDLCYQDLAVKERNMKICNNIFYTLTKNDCITLMNSLLQESDKKATKTYLEVLSLIIKANTFVIERDLNDACFPYRVQHLGCIHGETKDYLIASNLKEYDLTSEERIDLCYKFAHIGAIAYCLKSNNERPACFNLAKENPYLTRICYLEEGRIIPSIAFGPKEDNMEYKVDSYEPAELVKYSELMTPKNSIGV